jgi:hypothetical protein
MTAMKLTRILAATSIFAAALALPLLLRQNATHAASPAPAAAASPAAPTPAAPAGTCKTYGEKGKCCSPDVTMHLTKEAVYAACGESDATFLGEAGSKETCKYHFKVEGVNAEDSFVQVYAPVVKQVLDKPTDPFLSYKKVGKVWMTDKSKSPKAAAMAASSTGLYLPGRGYFVSVAASIKVCTKNEAITLSKSMK